MTGPATLRIAFLAISQAHQFLHWIPAALRLADEPGVEVTVLGSTDAGLDLVRSFDPQGTLRLHHLRTPPFSADSLFAPPPRVPTLLLNLDEIGGYDIIVTTETTSGLLRRVPGFSPRLILIKHGAGDREGSYNPKHRYFDRILVNGEKHRRALLERDLANDDQVVITGNAKLELTRDPPPIFTSGKPLALYNPHFDRELSTWYGHGRELIAEMGRIDGWDFVVAPHVKLKDLLEEEAAPPNVLIDPGSVRSIDMSYTQAADVYIGDVSSQVYEFVLTPRPCIFLNLERRPWDNDPAYAHWRFGQVIERVEELRPALARSRELQPAFAVEQQHLLARSLDRNDEPASSRQARAVLSFARGLTRRRHRQ